MEPKTCPAYICAFFFFLVNLLLLVDTELSGTAVDEQEETADDRKNLEEIVLGEVLVGVVLVKLVTQSVSGSSHAMSKGP